MRNKLLLISLLPLIIWFLVSETNETNENIETKSIKIDSETTLARETIQTDVLEKNLPQKVRIQNLRKSAESNNQVLKNSDESSNSENVKDDNNLEKIEISELEDKAEMDLLSEDQLLELALHFLEKDSFKPIKAKKYLRSLVSKHPNNQLALNELMALMTGSNELAEAESILTDIIDKNPNSAVINDAYGNFLVFKKKNFEASQYYKKALDLDPDHPQLMRKLAASYMHSGQSTKAIDIFEQIYRLENSDAQVSDVQKKFTLLELANAQIQSGRCLEGKSNLDQSTHPKLEKDFRIVEKRYDSKCI